MPSGAIGRPRCGTGSAAVVRELEVRTILDVRPARTAWEAAYSAARVLPASRDWLQRGAESFNAVVYGDRPADQAAYQQMVSVDEQVVAAADTTDWAADEPAVSPMTGPAVLRRGRIRWLVGLLLVTALVVAAVLAVVGSANRRQADDPRSPIASRSGRARPVAR